MKPALIGFVLAAVVLAVFFARSENYRFADGPDAHAYAADFLPDYVGAWIVRHGDPARLYDPAYHEPLQHDRSVLGFEWDAAKIYPLLYPPFYYAALAPLAGFEYRRAAQLWAGVLVLCWLAGAALAVGGLPALRPAMVWLLPASVIFPPLTESLASGQKGTILLLLFAAAFALWRGGWPLVAGAVFGLVAFKPQLGIAIGLLALWKREWRFVAGAVLSGGALLLAGIAVDGSFPASWLAATAAPASESARYFHFGHRNQCWFGFAELLLGTERQYAVAALTAALDGVTAACLLWLWRGPLRPGTPRFALQFSGAVLATVLVSHHALTYDLTVLLLPLALLLWVTRSHPEAMGVRPAAIYVAAAALFLLSGYAPRLAERIPLHLGVVAMFGMLALLAAGVRQAAPARPESS